MENPPFLTRICMAAYLFSLPFPSLCGVFRPAPLGFRQDLPQLCKKTAWVLFLIPNLYRVTLIVVARRRWRHLLGIIRVLGILWRFPNLPNLPNLPKFPKFPKFSKFSIHLPQKTGTGYEGVTRAGFTTCSRKVYSNERYLKFRKVA